MEGGATQTRDVVTYAIVDELLELRYEVCLVMKHQVHNATRGTRWRCNRIAFVAGLLAPRLQELGSYYGALPAHDGLWDSAIATSGSLLARLAVEHCVHEVPFFLFYCIPSCSSALV